MKMVTIVAIFLLAVSLHGDLYTTSVSASSISRSVLSTTTSDQCSTEPCGSSYHGIPREICNDVGCCWDQPTSQCRKKIREKCPGTYPGAPPSLCKEPQCVYDRTSRTCYKVASSSQGTNQSAPGRLLSGSNAGSHSPTQTCSTTPCKGSYSGMPRSLCSSASCCWNSQENKCYQKKSDPSGLGRSGGNIVSGNILVLAPVCTTTPCDGSYNGMPKRLCPERNCCWNSTNNKCYKKKIGQLGRTAGNLISGNGNNLDLAPVCTTTPCDGSYNGMPKRLCPEQSCCWNSTNNKCYKKEVVDLGRTGGNLVGGDLSDLAQDPVCSSTPCKGSYTGMPQSLCTNLKCCWNAENSKCYQNLPKTTKDCTSTPCKNSYNGMPRNACTNKGCCWNSEDKKCYKSKTDTSQLGRSGANIIPGDENNVEPESDVLCHALPSPPNGQVDCTADNGQGSRCEISCAPGYLVVGDASVVCSRNGSWMPAVSWSCQEIQCGPILEENLVDSSQNTLRCTRGWRYRSSCALECGKDYDNVGVDERVCLSDGTWSPGRLFCKEKPRCPEVFASWPNVNWSVTRYDCSDGTRNESICRFTCDKRYQLYGSPTSTTCNTDRTPQWSNPPPACIPGISSQIKLSVDLDLSRSHLILSNSHRSIMTLKEQQAGFPWDPTTCSAKALIEVDLRKIKTFSVKLHYNQPMFGHFEMIGEGFTFRGFHQNFYSFTQAGTTRQSRFFRHYHVIVLHIRPASGEMFYSVGRPNSHGSIVRIKLPQLKSTKKLTIGLNRLVQYIFPSASGMCKARFSYET